MIDNVHLLATQSAQSRRTLEIAHYMGYQASDTVQDELLEQEAMGSNGNIF